MNIATIIIPYAAYHKEVVNNAIESAYAQTVKCAVIAEWDVAKGTPAFVRNKALAVNTPFVVFLDADDTLELTFIEDCLRTYKDGTYVYTGWYEGDRVMMPRPCNPFLGHDFGDGRGGVGGYHLVTTLYPTEPFKGLGGFDTTLPGMEDIDLYMRSQRHLLCGILCPKPLVRYNGEGETRSKHFRALDEYQDIRDDIVLSNGGIESMAGCCGVVSGEAKANVEGAQPGDVPAETLYAPSTQFGRATGRFYPRPQFMGQVIMVAPEDIAKMPDMFRKVETLRELAPQREVVLKESGLL